MIPDPNDDINEVNLNKIELKNLSKHLINSKSSIMYSYIIGGVLIFAFICFWWFEIFEYLIIGPIGFVCIGYGIIRSRKLRESIYRYKTTIGRVDKITYQYFRGKHYYGYFNYSVDGVTFRQKEELWNKYYCYLFGFEYAKVVLIYDPKSPASAILAHKEIPGYDPKMEMDKLDHPTKAELNKSPEKK